MKKIGEVKKENHKKYYGIKVMLTIILYVTMIIILIPIFLDLIAAYKRGNFEEYSILYKYFISDYLVLFLMSFILETLIHELSHYIAILMCKGRPKIAWRSTPIFRNSKLTISNPQVYEENKVFTRNQYVLCLIMPIIALTMIFIIPFFIITKNIEWTLFFIALVLTGAIYDIFEAILLLKKSSKGSLVKMKIEEKHIIKKYASGYDIFI